MSDENEVNRYPVIRTERFDIHSHEIRRDKSLGFARTVFQAWYHSEDIPKPVCIVTINECFMDYVEWVHVDELHRRRGIAMEVVRAIEGVIPGITLEGATEAGEAFCDEYEKRYPSCPLG